MAEEGEFNGDGGVQRQRRWGLQIGNDEATIKIDISGNGWQRRASAFDSGDGRRWALAFDGGDGRQSGSSGQERLRSMAAVVVVFDGGSSV